MTKSKAKQKILASWRVTRIKGKAATDFGTYAASDADEAIAKRHTPSKSPPHPPKGRERLARWTSQQPRRSRRHDYPQAISATAVAANAKKEDVNSMELNYPKIAGDITIPTRGVFMSTNCIAVIQESCKVDLEEPAK